MFMKALILKDFKEFIFAYGIRGILFGIGIIFLYVIILWSVKKFFNPQLKIRGSLLTVIYIFSVYCYLVLEIAYFSREPGSRTRADLMIGATFQNTPRAMSYVIENIIMMIPLGFLVPILWKRIHTVWRCLAVGFLTSLAIEIFQFISERGYFQTDDIITNVFGTLIGYGMYLCIRKVGNIINRNSGKEIIQKE